MDRDGLLRTGLFEGRERLRFAHLSLGEYLAAEDEFDLAVARTRLVAAERVEGSALEVLPMAHAIRGGSVLEGALADASTRDRPDHRLLRLLLRSIGYGGDGVRMFLRTQSAEVVRRIADRLQGVDGRFADPERELMDDAERALLLLRDHIESAVALTAFAPLLRTGGEAAAEAHTATWILGAAPISRAPTRFWKTTFRQARALVRAQASVEHVRQWTTGSDVRDIEHAAHILAAFPEYWPRIRGCLDHTSERVRRVAMHALRDDPRATADLRERWTDDNSAIRARMIALSDHTAHDDALRSRLHWALTRDRSYQVRAAAITRLAREPSARPWIRRALDETMDVPQRFSSDFAELHRAALRSLVDDDESSDTIRRRLTSKRLHRVLSDVRLLRYLAHNPAWYDILLRRLDSPDVVPDEVKAMSGVPGAQPAIRRLLQAPDEHVVIAAIGALRTLDLLDQATLLGLLTTGTGWQRQAAIGRLGELPEHWPALHRFLEAPDDADRKVALQALAQDPSIQDRAFDLLHADAADTVVYAAIEVLARRRTGRAALREYFTAMRSHPHHEVVPGSGLRMLGWQRANIVAALAKDPHRFDRALLRDALADPHPEVRASAITHIADEEWRQSPPLHLLKDADRSAREAASRKMAAHPDVRAYLVGHLDKPDDWALRMAAFGVLVDHEGPRAELVKSLHDPATPPEVRATLLQPLLRDSNLREDVRHFIAAEDRDVRNTALSLLRNDPETRRRLRESIRDPEGFTALTHEPTPLDILANDMEARPILLEHFETALATDNAGMLALVLRTLAKDPGVRTRCLALLRHEDINVRLAAIAALGTDETNHDRLMELFDHDSQYIRVASAQALGKSRTARPRFVTLLADPHEDMRKAAIAGLAGERTDEETTALRVRLAVEHDDELRQQILTLLADDPSGVEILRARLHDDTNSDIRRASARQLRSAERQTGVRFDHLPAIARVLAVAAGQISDDPLSARLHAWWAHPEPFDLAADPAFGESLLAWAAVRLAWASEDGSMASGRVFGEVERVVRRLGDTDMLVIRVRMDVAELPRERHIRPTHNLLEAWSRATYLRAAYPPAVVLACADADFVHLAPPNLSPGEVHWGPTFFGFRLHASAPPRPFSCEMVVRP